MRVLLAVLVTCGMPFAALGIVWVLSTVMTGCDLRNRADSIAYYGCLVVDGVYVIACVALVWLFAFRVGPLR